MTITQYKKIIRSMSREELEAHIFQLFAASKAFKDIESSYFSSSDSEKQLEQLEKKLSRAFAKDNFSLSECKGILKDAVERCFHKPTVALMQLRFATEAAETSAAFGDFGDSFYNALEKEAEHFLDYARTDEAFFQTHEDEFEKLIETCDEIGYGLAESLDMMYEDAKIEVYGEEE